MAEAFIGLGSNLGDGPAILREAARRLDALPAVRVTARSRLYRTPPWGKLDQPPFVNAALRVDTTLSPHELLDACQGIEAALGRVRAERWGPRRIDLDLLCIDDLTVADERLVLHHPLMFERAFVLVPLAEIAPALRVGGRSIAVKLAKLDRAGIEPMTDPL